MEPNHSPTASSFTMRQPSLSDLLASVHNGETFAFGLSRGGLTVPLAATRTYTLDNNDPFANIPPVEPRPDTRRAAAPFTATSSSSAAAAASTTASNTNSPSHHHAPRRSQRLAACSSTRETETNSNNASSEGRKRKAPSPRKRAVRKKPPPSTKDDPEAATEDRKPAAVEENEEGGEPVSCCICMCEPEKEDISSINGCEHMFCFDCIGKWADRENTCPLCKCRFTSISRVHKIKRRKGEKQAPNSKRVKQRDQRADVISGPAIEAMLASIAAASNGTHNRFGRFLVALGSRRAPTRVASSRRTTLILEDDIFSDETDDDELPMINFNQLMRRAAHGYPRTAVPPAAFDFGFGPMPAQFAATAMPPPAPPQYRNHASNTFEQNAGTPSNPLEIDLSEDDDDSEVEVFDASSSSA
uniref:RING-type domain-containing protein n=1 Tax=Amphora coffeiformis TaxID=265554 RepID=A0A6S8JAS2_9STRA|mmetsp:Transcript_11995/g.22928  ORF Transcript_11995/g.22928 Transcript_11995/m.22928 type:complete len:415 (+) Transcript_11995:575-1819(+)|eukprot:scaffold4003_cov165-Amphora_coffeaeformis.AAC.4